MVKEYSPSIIESKELTVKIKPKKQGEYGELSTTVLTNFCDSLEATLDNNASYHLFPELTNNKEFGKLFDYQLCYFENKNNTTMNTRNILLIGRTGGGKSTLGNVLINKNDNFDEVFGESSQSVSETKNVKEAAVEIDISRDGSEKVKYRIIDTIGLGDTKLTPQGVLTRLAEVASRVKSGGLNHIFFVTQGRFSKEEIEAYDLLSSIIFDSDVLKYTTIVRTNFPSFEKEEACANDRAALRMENADLAHILGSVNVIYVDNPPLEGRPRVVEINKETREESRKRLLTYLAGCQGNYRPNNIDELDQRVQDYKTNEQKLKDKMKEMEADRKRKEEEFRKKLADMKEEYTQELRKNKRQFEENLDKAKKESDKKLEETKKKLEEDGQKKLDDAERRAKERERDAETRHKQDLKRVEDSHEQSKRDLQNQLQQSKSETESLKKKVDEASSSSKVDISAELDKLKTEDKEVRLKELEIEKFRAEKEEARLDELNKVEIERRKQQKEAEKKKQTQEEKARALAHEKEAAGFTETVVKGVFTNMHGRKKRLEEFINKFDISLTILEFEKLFSEVKEIYPSDEELPSSTVGGEKLKKLKNHQKNLEEGGRIDKEFDKYIKVSPSLADEYEKQKKEAKESKKKLDKLLKDDEPRQKAEELLNKYKNNSPFSEGNSDKDAEFDEQITNLQNQIKDLENRQNQDSSLERDHKYKQELEKSKRELEDLKKKNQKTSVGEKDNNFPTGLVVGGIVKFPSTLTKRIELDDQFFTAAQQFANETLDFSYYSELEQIVNISKIQGVIKKIDVSQNKGLVELTLPNQKLTRLNLSNNKKLITLNVSNNQLADIAKCSKIKFLACQNNYLNELRVHKDLRYLLVSSGQNYLQPQNHDKNRIHPLKNVTYVTPLESQNAENEIIESDSLQVKLKPLQRVNYRNISENALNRFVNSLEATLDNDSFFHLFPVYDDNKSFEELFDFNKIFCGKKTDKKKIGEASYGDLEKLFYNWKKANQGKTKLKTETRKSAVSRATSDKVRNILLIGRTGSGKSTLANVLINKDGEFGEIFRESAGSVSETRNIQSEKFSIDISKNEEEKINYRVIDTIGFGDTKLSNKAVLQLLQDLVPIIGDDGLNQILFVTDGRFTEKEIETYKLLETVIFDKEVVDFTTIIRVRFPKFEDNSFCNKDRERLRGENEEIFRILKASKIIYLNNPPLEGRATVIELAKETREESRKRLLTYLATCQDIYYPANLTEFKQRIDDYQTKSEQLEKELREKEKVVKEQEDKFQSDILATQTRQQIDLELSRRKFEQKIKTAKNAETRRKAEINRIESEFKNRKVRVGEAVCSRGHSNVTAYNKHGNRPDPDDFEDTISYVYCSSCGKNDYSCEVRNATSYNFEEWCKMRNQSYARELEQMNQQIQEQERRKQEIINRIQQERRDRDAIFRSELEKQRQTQQQIVNKERMIDEERTKQQKATIEGRINSASQERENQLRRELAEMKKKQAEQIRQSKAKRDAAQQELYAYIEQRRN
ncbi:44743_t:CDS:10 [Gigaspora margarita]|uniref:44743_t:CDS:1 n=1 Tax=Gigaspora margarita TaxID=4874 RepID=A0ABN7VAB2_GIGMA|nr:44743_t:CDS:10 [Gigaspora margarita]